MTVESELQQRWRPEGWEPSEGDIGTALQTVKAAVEHTCAARHQLAGDCLHRAREQMADGSLAGMAVMFGAMLLAHPVMPERFWRLRQEIEATELTEQQRAIYVEALGLMLASPNATRFVAMRYAARQSSRRCTSARPS